MSLLNSVALWQEVIYDLVNTCESMEQVLADHDALDLEEHQPFLEHLDTQIFRCENCCWWYPVSEMSGNSEGNCVDCMGDDEED